MPAPASVPITGDQLRRIGRRFGLGELEARLLAPVGLINSTYSIDAKHVLRVPRDHPAHVEQTRREAATLPVVCSAEVRTARLVGYDDTREILPVPYLILERLNGRNLEAAGLDPVDSRNVWRALGRDLARVHATPAPPELLAFPADEYDAILTGDPRILAEQRASEGWLSPLEARWLTRWLDRLPRPVDGEVSKRLVHADVQMSNIMVEPVRDRYRAIFDWGCARIADTAMDFLSMPMAAVPHLLAGHRDIAPLPQDETMEARILWRRMQMMLGVLPRGPAPGQAWGERPVAWLADLFRFFARPPGPTWRALSPPP